MLMLLTSTSQDLYRNSLEMNNPEERRIWPHFAVQLIRRGGELAGAEEAMYKGLTGQSN